MKYLKLEGQHEIIDLSLTGNIHKQHRLIFFHYNRISHRPTPRWEFDTDEECVEAYIKVMDYLTKTL